MRHSLARSVVGLLALLSFASVALGTDPSGPSSLAGADTLPEDAPIDTPAVLLRMAVARRTAGVVNSVVSEFTNNPQASTVGDGAVATRSQMSSYLRAPATKFNTILKPAF